MKHPRMLILSDDVRDPTPSFHTDTLLWCKATTSNNVDYKITFFSRKFLLNFRWYRIMIKRWRLWKWSRRETYFVLRVWARWSMRLPGPIEMVASLNKNPFKEITVLIKRPHNSSSLDSYIHFTTHFSCCTHLYKRKYFQWWYTFLPYTVF